MGSIRKEETALRYLSLMHSGSVVILTVIAIRCDSFAILMYFDLLNFDNSPRVKTVKTFFLTPMYEINERYSSFP